MPGCDAARESLQDAAKGAAEGAKRAEAEHESALKEAEAEQSIAAELKACREKIAAKRDSGHAAALMLLGEKISAAVHAASAARTRASRAMGAWKRSVAKAASYESAMQALQAEGLDVTGIEPKSGTVKGGTKVAVTGTGFATGAKVVIGAPAMAVKVVSGSRIECTTAAHAKGVVPVTVELGDDGVTLPDAYTYTEP